MNVSLRRWSAWAAVAIAVAGLILPACASASADSRPSTGATVTSHSARFHKYSRAFERSEGDYDGAREVVQVQRYRYRGGHVGCVYNPLWLGFEHGWIETGLSHNCNGHEGIRVYGYVSCNGSAHFVGSFPVSAGRRHRLLTIRKAPGGYVLRDNGRTWQRVRVPAQCRSPHHMSTGLETYSPYAEIPRQVDRHLAYLRDGRWTPWSGQDFTTHSTGLRGHWHGPHAFVFAEVQKPR